MTTVRDRIIITVTAAPQPPPSGLIFHSGFQPASGPFNTELLDITGVDGSVSPPNNWDALNFRINYEGGGERFAKIIDDPTPGHALGNRVLHFWLRNPADPPTAPAARVQSSYSPGLTEAFQRVRMYVHPDLWLATSAQRFMFQEIWIRPNWTGQVNSFSLPFDIGFDPAVHTTYWRFQGRDVDPPSVTRIWEVINTTVPVPVGEWFTAETYYKMGNDTSGRIVFAIQRDGQAKQIVANVTNWTYHPEEAPRGIFQWHPHKLYGKAAADAVRAGGGVLQMYWDDWQVWNRPPAGSI